jgi:DNA-binding NarL/FixJ family response regulator
MSPSIPDAVGCRTRGEAEVGSSGSSTVQPYRRVDCARKKPREFLLHDLEGLSNAEIAEVLQLKLATVSRGCTGRGSS